MTLLPNLASVVLGLVCLSHVTSSITALDCRRTTLGTEYSGTASKTISGLDCQAWASQTPQQHTAFDNLPDGSQEAALNYCRNPDNSPNGPWCYTTDPNHRWEYCDVPLCDVCKKTKQGVEYNGYINQTVSGRTCQKWVDQTPQEHTVFTNFPEGSESAALNYCRNPDNSPNGPWCYTMDASQRWEYCDIIACECKTTTLGTEYNGILSTTISGRTCQKWADQSPQQHNVFTKFPEGSEAEAQNFCRNPDDSPDGPWCYTTDPSQRFEYCNVKNC